MNIDSPTPKPVCSSDFFNRDWGSEKTGQRTVQLGCEKVVSPHSGGSLQGVCEQGEVSVEGRWVSYVPDHWWEFAREGLVETNTKGEPQGGRR